MVTVRVKNTGAPPRRTLEEARATKQPVQPPQRRTVAAPGSPHSSSEYRDSEIQAVRELTPAGTPLSSECSEPPRNTLIDDEAVSLTLGTPERPSSPLSTSVTTIPSTAQLSAIKVDSHPATVSTTNHPRVLHPTASKRLLTIDDRSARRIERIALQRRGKIEKKKSRVTSIWCNLCSKHVNSNEYRDHCKGKKHQTKLRAQEEKSLNLHCPICNLTFQSLHNLNQHYRGKRHHINLRYQNLNKN